jgi:membrane protein
VAALLFMVSTFFVTIQGFLNLIFEVKITRSLPQSVWIMLRNRFLSIAMLGIITFILIFSMVISVLINASAEIIDKWIGAHLIWLQLFNYVVLNLIVLTLLFAFMFRYIPDKRLKWSDTWIGAVFTSMLFITGKSLIGFLIGNSYVANYYDASGGVLVIMLWIYYSMAIFLFGAIFTNCRSKLLNG